MVAFKKKRSGSLAFISTEECDQASLLCRLYNEVHSQTIFDAELAEAVAVL